MSIQSKFKVHLWLLAQNLALNIIFGEWEHEYLAPCVNLFHSIYLRYIRLHVGDADKNYSLLQLVTAKPPKCPTTELIHVHMAA